MFRLKDEVRGHSVTVGVILMTRDLWRRLILLEMIRNFEFIRPPELCMFIYQDGLVFPALTLMLLPLVLCVCAVLRVRQKFFSVLEPQQTHARALRRAALQMRLLQQGEGTKKKKKPCGF